VDDHPSLMQDWPRCLRPRRKILYDHGKDLGRVLKWEVGNCIFQKKRGLGRNQPRFSSGTGGSRGEKKDCPPHENKKSLMGRRKRERKGKKCREIELPKPCGPLGDGWERLLPEVRLKTK